MISEIHSVPEIKLLMSLAHSQEQDAAQSEPHDRLNVSSLPMHSPSLVRGHVSRKHVAREAKTQSYTWKDYLGEL